MNDIPAGRRREGYARLADADLFVETLDRFERGEISADAWRAFSHLHGVYGQRQDGDRAMLRVKIPLGALEAPQLRALALVAELFSRGFGHVTTRQDLQFHFVRLGDLEAAMRILAEAGLTTREACGNSVRNVTACPLSGVAEDEIFDVAPYAEAAARHLLGHPLSSSLPRKLKIAFEGCAGDHALTAIHDIGLRARLRSEGGCLTRGFAVAVGGGTGTVPASARPLVDFLPARDLLALLEAVVSVFHRRGDRKNRHSNRMKFLIRAMGWGPFREEVERELAALRARGAPSLPFDPDRPPAEAPPSWRRPPAPRVREVAARTRATALRGPGVLPVIGPDAGGEAELAAWLATNVLRQRQAGFTTVAVPLPLGDITADQLRVVAELAAAYGDGTVRLTATQDLLLRWVPAREAPELFRRLAAAGLGKDGYGTAADVVSCPGAESCKLAVTASRGVGRLVEEHLRARPDLVSAAGDLTVKVSGCPSGCSQHHVAGIGLQGSARKLGGRAVPQYFVLVGGGVATRLRGNRSCGDPYARDDREEGEARFGRLVAKIPARRVPEAVERLILLYRAERAHGESAAAFLARVPLERARAALRDLGELTTATARPDDYLDPGEEAGAPAEAVSDERAA